MADSTSLTVEQLHLVLHEIANAAGTLAEFAKIGANNLEGRDLEQGYHVISAMAERIGLLADAASGEGVIGSPMAWCCGPNYPTSHEVAPHG